MKKIFSLGLFLAALIFTNALPANAQTARRVQFEKGKNSAVVKSMTGKYGTAYVVRAKSGQKLTLNLTPAAKIGVKVTANLSDGETVLLREEKGGDYEIGLDESGDYTIFVGSTDQKSVAFTLRVKITAMSDL